MSLEGAIAAHRFGLGARPGEIEAASANPKAWLLSQLDRPLPQPQAVSGPPFANAAELVSRLVQYRRDRQQAKESNTLTRDIGSLKQERKDLRHEFKREIAGRCVLGFTTDRPFAERLTWFWSNHFTVSATANQAREFLGSFEREAIRPHVTGKFEDMLLAVAHHPAMLFYLNNAQSIGPNSPVGKRTGKGINENFGRELMELHTLGVDGGYTQADVIALAKILTGWTFARTRNATGFRFAAQRHEPGPIVLRGKTYNGGEEAGIQALKDLAHDPATARHIARQMATEFISDKPSAQSVARLEHVFKSTNGDLKAMAVAVVNDPAGWRTDSVKMRSPVEFVTAAMRALSWQPRSDDAERIGQIMNALRMMGEVPFEAPSPKGWPYDSDAWTGSDALLNRLQWARAIGSGLEKRVDAIAIAQASLGPLLQPATRNVLKTARDSGEAVALLLASPEFQRR